MKRQLKINVVCGKNIYGSDENIESVFCIFRSGSIQKESKRATSPNPTWNDVVVFETFENEMSMEVVCTKCDSEDICHVGSVNFRLENWNEDVLPFFEKKLEDCDAEGALVTFFINIVDVPENESILATKHSNSTDFGSSIWTNFEKSLPEVGSPEKVFKRITLEGWLKKTPNQNKGQGNDVEEETEGENDDDDEEMDSESRLFSSIRQYKLISRRHVRPSALPRNRPSPSDLNRKEVVSTEISNQSESVVLGVYSGEVVYNELYIIPDGVGRMIFPNQRVEYDGHYKFGQKNGFGILFNIFDDNNNNNNNELQKKSKKNVKKNSKQTFKPRIHKIIGDWKDNRPLSEEKDFEIHYENGEIYKGGASFKKVKDFNNFDFSQIERDGRGVLIHESSSRQQHLKIRQFVRDTTNDNKRKLHLSCYYGEWKDDNPHGYGILIDLKNGERYTGFFRNGLKDGEGCISRSDGSLFYGNFQKGEKVDHGAYYLSNGYRIQCQWDRKGSSGGSIGGEKSSNYGQQLYLKNMVMEEGSFGECSKNVLHFVEDEIRRRTSAKNQMIVDSSRMMAQRTKIRNMYLWKTMIQVGWFTPDFENVVNAFGGDFTEDLMEKVLRDRESNLRTSLECFCEYFCRFYSWWLEIIKSVKSKRKGSGRRYRSVQNIKFQNILLLARDDLSSFLNHATSSLLCSIRELSFGVEEYEIARDDDNIYLQEQAEQEKIMKGGGDGGGGKKKKKKKSKKKKKKQKQKKFQFLGFKSSRSEDLKTLTNDITSNQRRSLINEYRNIIHESIHNFVHERIYDVLFLVYFEEFREKEMLLRHKITTINHALKSFSNENKIKFLEYRLDEIRPSQQYEIYEVKGLRSLLESSRDSSSISNQSTSQEQLQKNKLSSSSSSSSPRELIFEKECEYLVNCFASLFLKFDTLLSEHEYLKEEILNTCCPRIYREYTSEKSEADSSSVSNWLNAYFHDKHYNKISKNEEEEEDAEDGLYFLRTLKEIENELNMKRLGMICLFHLRELKILESLFQSIFISDVDKFEESLMVKYGDENIVIEKKRREYPFDVHLQINSIRCAYTYLRNILLVASSEEEEEEESKKLSKNVLFLGSYNYQTQQKNLFEEDFGFLFTSLLNSLQSIELSLNYFSLKSLDRIRQGRKSVKHLISSVITELKYLRNNVRKILNDPSSSSPNNNNNNNNSQQQQQQQQKKYYCIDSSVFHVLEVVDFENEIDDIDTVPEFTEKGKHQNLDNGDDENNNNKMNSAFQEVFEIIDDLLFRLENKCDIGSNKIVLDESETIEKKLKKLITDYFPEYEYLMIRWNNIHDYQKAKYRLLKSRYHVILLSEQLRSCILEFERIEGFFFSVKQRNNYEPKSSLIFKSIRLKLTSIEGDISRYQKKLIIEEKSRLSLARIEKLYKEEKAAGNRSNSSSGVSNNKNNKNRGKSFEPSILPIRRSQSFSGVGSGGGNPVGRGVDPKISSLLERMKKKKSSSYYVQQKEMKLRRTYSSSLTQRAKELEETDSASASSESGSSNSSSSSSSSSNVSNAMKKGNQGGKGDDVGSENYRNDFWVNCINLCAFQKKISSILKLIECILKLYGNDSNNDNNNNNASSKKEDEYERKKKKKNKKSMIDGDVLDSSSDTAIYNVIYQYCEDTFLTLKSMFQQDVEVLNFLSHITDRVSSICERTQCCVKRRTTKRKLIKLGILGVKCKKCDEVMRFRNFLDEGSRILYYTGGTGTDSISQDLIFPSLSLLSQEQKEQQERKRQKKHDFFRKGNIIESLMCLIHGIRSIQLSCEYFELQKEFDKRFGVFKKIMNLKSSSSSPSSNNNNNRRRTHKKKKKKYGNEITQLLEKMLQDAYKVQMEMKTETIETFLDTVFSNKVKNRNEMLLPLQMAGVDPKFIPRSYSFSSSIKLYDSNRSFSSSTSSNSLKNSNNGDNISLKTLHMNVDSSTTMSTVGQEIDEDENNTFNETVKYIPYGSSIILLNQLCEMTNVGDKLRILSEFDISVSEEMKRISKKDILEEDDVLPVVLYVLMQTDLNHYVEFSYIRDWMTDEQMSKMVSRYEIFFKYIETLDPYARGSKGELLSVMGNIFTPLRHIIEDLLNQKKMNSVSWLVNLFNYIYCEIGKYKLESHGFESVLEIVDSKHSNLKNQMMEEIENVKCICKNEVVGFQVVVRQFSINRKLVVSFENVYSPNIYRYLSEQILKDFKDSMF